MQKQFEYTVNKGIRHIIFVGSEQLNKNTFQIKVIQEGIHSELEIEKIIEMV